MCLCTKNYLDVKQGSGPSLGGKSGNKTLFSKGVKTPRKNGNGEASNFFLQKLTMRDKSVGRKKGGVFIGSSLSGGSTKRLEWFGGRRAMISVSG